MNAYEQNLTHSLQLTREWVRELAASLGWEDENRAFRLLRVTLQAIRDWLDVNEASQLGAQLPILLRGLYYEGWHPAKTPVSERAREDFLFRVSKTFATDPLENETEAVGAVFRLLNARITAGEISDVRHRLPRHLRELWPE